MKKIFLTLLLLCGFALPGLRAQMNEGENTTDAAVPQNPAMAPVQDVAGLPRVLLIGDSISIGYTPVVRDLLKGKANVHRIPVNGGTTLNGVSHLDQWLGDGKWDVIHFNFGLHDAKYLTETATKVDRVQYEKNLRAIVKRLQATGAKLVWASTTPVPAVLQPAGRRFDDITAYNAIAAKVMADNNIPIDDLYSVILPKEKEFQRPGDVHFFPPGWQLLGATVAASITPLLPSPKS